MPAKTKETAKPGIEALLNELETLVNHLEDGESSLEDSLLAFERGMKLSKEALATLSSAEQKVNLLLERNGEPEASSFSEEDKQA